MLSSLTTAAAICLGACTGALLRWKLGLWLSTETSLPWGTLVANASGGFLIGLVVGTLQNHPDIEPVWRALLVTGFLGALTTFSTFSLEVVQLAQAQRLWAALGWAGLHMGSSLLLTVAGLACAQGFWTAR